VAIGFGGGWTVQGWRADKALADQKAVHEDQVRKTLKAERDNLTGVLNEERALRAKAEEAAHELRERQNLHQRSAAGASAELQRLLDDARRRPAAWACAPSATAAAASGTAPGTAAGVVPSQPDRIGLLEESATGFVAMAQHAMACDATHRALTAYYDEARARLKRMGEAGRTLETKP
jgi:hypothetical protein